jgi:hypothetical protein
MKLTPEQIEQNAAAVKAHLEGRPFQYRHKNWHYDAWSELSGGSFDFHSYLYRPAPEWQLPAPPEGKRWHCDRWTQDMLPNGWRPLLKGEETDYGDERLNGGEWEEFRRGGSFDNVYCAEAYHRPLRTRRPLPEPPKPWDCPEDVPVPVCWICNVRGIERLVVQVDSTGICLHDGELTWKDIATAGVKYATDRREWRACVKQ